jgi:Metallo-peptidase family M12B Reprolysin-like
MFQPSHGKFAPLRPIRLAVEELEARITPTAPAGNSILWQNYASTSAFSLHSDPGATKVIYMDFNGATVSGTSWNTQFNGGAAFTIPAWSMDANRASFSTTELDTIIEMWRMVAEDYLPFDVDVTTQDPGAAAMHYSGLGDTHWGDHVIIGADPGTVVSGSPTAWPKAGGIAFVGTFKDPVNSVCFVWNGDMSAVPEFSLPDSVSHEVGHTLGLTHDGDTSMGAPGTTYYGGHGAGVTSWGPIMGAPFGRELTQWSRNTYPNADNPQDDLAIISSAANGFGYRADDYGNTTSTAKLLDTALQANLNTTFGVIGRNTDSDYFRFVADPGPATINVTALFVGPDLDVRADLYNASGALIATYNPLNAIDVSIATFLPYSGTYYLRVSGASLPGPTGYTNYGSLGSYTIDGTVTPYKPGFATFRAVNPIRWLSNSLSHTYDGYVSIGTLTGLTFSATFTITLTLPDPSMRVIAPNGVQTGNTFTFKMSGTIGPNAPLHFYLRLTNPLHLPLYTGLHTYVTNIVVS